MGKYPEEIMRNIRQNLGLEADDTSRYDYIMQMDKEDAFDCCLIWEGICGYGSLILSMVNGIYGTELVQIKQ